MPEELKLGGTGEFPDGKLNAADEGELRSMIGLDTANNILVMKFGKSVSWLGLGKKEVLALILLLQKWLRKMEAAAGEGRGGGAGPSGLMEDAASAEGESQKYPRDHRVLYAYIGPDQFGSGVIGLKQARVPAGMIPLVAMEREKIDRPEVIEQLQCMVDAYLEPIALVRYELVEELFTLTPPGGSLYSSWIKFGLPQERQKEDGDE